MPLCWGSSRSYIECSPSGPGDVEVEKSDIMKTAHLLIGGAPLLWLFSTRRWYDDVRVATIGLGIFDIL